MKNNTLHLLEDIVGVVEVGIIVVVVVVVVMVGILVAIEIVAVDIVVVIGVLVFTLYNVNFFPSVIFSFSFIALSNSSTSSKIWAEVSAKRKNNPWNFMFDNEIEIERIERKL